MRFVIIDGSVCVTTHFNLNDNIETSTVSYTASVRSTDVVNSRSITGEMLVFRRGSLPILFEGDTMPERVQIQYATDDRLCTADNVMFVSFRRMPHSYDACDAAYVEFAAESISIDTIPKDINSRMTL
jgi:hypothetical protein